jgi:hypothetical protein
MSKYMHQKLAPVPGRIPGERPDGMAMQYRVYGVAKWPKTDNPQIIEPMKLSFLTKPGNFLYSHKKLSEFTVCHNLILALPMTVFGI